jgi:phage terminase large subunit-like protein
LKRSGFCPAHQDTGRRTKAESGRRYDAGKRNRASKKFYDSAAWKAVRRSMLAEFPVCQRCFEKWSAHVHHKKPLDQCTDAEKVDPANLLPVCSECHNVLESEAEKAKSVAEAVPLPVSRTFTVKPDARFTFDAVAAEKPVKFIEKFCKHWEGRFAGQPFLLLDWQKEIIRTLFGWKVVETGLRRFQELYIISAKGAGKTPMIAAIGLYMLLADGEAAPHVISMASTFEQANLTFDAGKKYIAGCPALQSHTRVKQYGIQTRTNGKWTTISGKPTGRSGPRPSCVIADEVHEWPGPTAVAYELLCANLFKRPQPLLLVATNAGTSRTGFAFQLHERACKVSRGELDDPTLLPVIFEASTELPWDSEEAAAAANPSLGSVVKWSQLAPQLAKAKESTAAQANYRRLYLAQFAPGGGSKWLDMGLWDRAMQRSAPDAETLAKMDLFVGVDLSKGDDLCASVSVWTSPDLYFVRSRFWLPAATAEKYERSEGHQYREWSKAGAIELLTETTITTEVQDRIAAAIIADVQGHQIKAVCYDRYRADAVIARIEAARITCIPIAQGYSVTPGCTELERRLTAGSIAIDPNPVMRSHAEAVEVQTDARGNYWPRKPNAKGKYAGRRGIKVDGIAAVVTAITETKKRDAVAAEPEWTGKIEII